MKPNLPIVLLVLAGLLGAPVETNAGASEDLSLVSAINKAGRQRMLSQRAAKFYMLREWGFDRPSIRDEMERARNEFGGALAALRAAPENTDAILAALDEAELSWTWFDHALSLRGEETYRLIVADSTEAILAQMDRVTGMYEQLAPGDRQIRAKARQ